MLDAMILGASLLLVFFVGYVFGWFSGRSSGKIAALEAAHGLDLSDSGGDDDGR